MSRANTRRGGTREGSACHAPFCSCGDSPLSVLVVDTSGRRTIASLLEREPDVRLIGCVDSGRAALDRVHAQRPALVLMDLTLPDVDSIELIRRIRHESSHSEIIVLASARNEARARLALRAGAFAYVLKGLMRHELLKTIRILRRKRGDTHGLHVRARAPVPGAPPLLSKREIEVLSRIATGHSNAGIAACLSVSEETVKGHVKNILSKLNANDRAHAVALGLKRAIIELI